MSGALAILAEAILRVEFKVDTILRSVGQIPNLPPMHFLGTPCPVCRRAIEYQIDLVCQVVKRVCDCSTGKQPPLTPLIPFATQESDNAARRRTEPTAGPDDSPTTEDSPRRQGH